MRHTTTPTFVCSLPADCSNFEIIEAYFAQKGRVILKISKDSMLMNGKEVEFTLSTIQTSLFSVGVVAELQMRLVTDDGKVLVSDIRHVTVRMNLSDYV